jgi:LacI family transcriptional regulator
MRKSEPKPGETAPRIAVLCNTMHGVQREVLLGIRAFALGRPRWTMRFLRWTQAPLPGLRRLLRRWRPAGILAYVDEPEQAGLVRSLRIPAMDCTDALAETLPVRVMPDNSAVGRSAARHLLERAGRNLFVVSPGRGLWAAERVAAFLTAARELGVEAGEHRIAWRTYEERDRALAAFLKRIPKPAGLYACNDPEGVNLVRLCHDLGLSVPGQVAVLGTGNDEFLCEFSMPRLSSIPTREREVGKQAAALLERLMRGGRPPSGPVRVPPEAVVERESTWRIATADSLVRAVLQILSEPQGVLLSVKELGARLGVSRRTLELRFRQAMGRSPGAELRERRYQRARALLATTDLPIREVAAASGFGSAAYLSTAIRKRLGQAPSAMRKSRRRFWAAPFEPPARPCPAKGDHWS